MIKLCNNETAPKNGEEGYNPAYKFDMLWNVMVHNVNAITKDAELDLCGDETTYATGLYGEKGSGIVGRVVGKPGVSKGGQIVMISDVHRVQPRAYVHCHKLNKDSNFTISGNLEVKMICDKLKKLVDGTEGHSKKYSGHILI